MDRVDELAALCYAGEELLATAPVEVGAVGVTTHRVLVLRPDGPGARFRSVDRPNVTELAARTSGPTTHRDRAVIGGIVAVALLAAGTLIDLGGIVEPVDAPTGTGSGMLGLVNARVAALGLVDEALLLLGLGVAFASLGSLAWYLYRRDRVLEITVAGGDPIRVPLARDETGVADPLQAALATAQADSEVATFD